LRMGVGADEMMTEPGIASLPQHDLVRE